MVAERHRETARGKARHRKSRHAGQPQVIYPTFTTEPQRFVTAPAPAPFAFTTGSSKYVGRVGALAVALGVGVMVTTGHGLGIAHAEAGTDSSDGASTDGSPESGSGGTPDTEPSPGESPDTEPASTGSSDAPTTAPGDDGTSSTAPEMEVDSSGGLDTSINDAGQLTDEEETPATSTETEEDSAAAADSGVDAAAGDTEIPVAQEDSTPTEPTTGEVPPAPEAGEPVQGSGSDPNDQPSQAADNGEGSQALSLMSAADDQSTAADQQLFTAFTTSTAQTDTFSEFETFRHIAPEPLEMLGVVLPRGLVTAATTMVGLLLSPFLAPGPLDPAQPPLLWVVLGWVRREINRTFFNLSPVIHPQDITLTLEPGEVSGPIEFDAYDGDDDPLTYRVPERGRAGGPEHGTVTVDQATGTFTYKADAGYTGTDQFTVAVSDHTSGLHMHGLLSLLGWHRAHTDRAKIRLNVVAANGAPVANPDSVSTLEDTPLTGHVLTNDTGAGSDPLTASLVSGPGHGTLSLDDDGSFSYAPDANWNGVDSFTYKASSGTATSNTATVTVAVTPVNDAPIADDDSYSVAEDGTLTVATAGVLDNDSDLEGSVSTASLVDGPEHGVVTLNENGTFVYKPDEEFTGTDTFTYTASDGAMASDEATVSIAVAEFNSIADDSYTVDEDTELTVPAATGVLAGDTDPDGDPLTAALVSGPAHGTLHLNANGSFSYAPDANFNGTDSFTYSAFDGQLNSAPATVTITVTAVNDAPLAANNSYTVAEDGTLNVTTPGVLTGDTDIENNP
ncbi:MAG: hypothetical protein QOD39_1030, partial [Mycobacterium sp.]|nr:hypothetical protein [Mycobacterium sp.]